MTSVDPLFRRLALRGFRYNLLVLQEPSFETLLSNLTNLRELYLDGVDISSSGREDWGRTLGKYVPHLQVLSMEECRLVGPIHRHFLRLRSIEVINLKMNGISGVVPEFFADFLNLRVLQLSFNNLRGTFPPKIFQLKNLAVLDVSNNDQLSGLIPKFLHGSSLETLNLQDTHFSGVTLSYLGNLTSLTDLGIDGRSISMEPPYFFVDKMDHVSTLRLSSVNFSREARSNFSWIGDLQSLKTLKISDCYSTKTMPSWIGNLTSLRSLDIRYCGSIGPIPQLIGNLTTLEYLTISDCAFTGQLLSSVGNLENLRFLQISYNHQGLSGPITPTIGHLNKLTVLILRGCSFSGRIPNTIANMTKLIFVDLSQNDLVGGVPTFLFTLPSLLQLDLSSNQLSGPIQEFHTLSSCIEVVTLNDNKISGNIPSALFHLINLVILDLSSNNITGFVDLDDFWKLRKLAQMSLSNNKLYIKEGKRSNSTFRLLPKLTELDLKSCGLTEIPSFLVHLDHITILDLSCNKILGTIPNWIWHTWDHSLRNLNLSNNAFTNLQLTSYILPNSHLEFLDLSSNRIQGQIPIPNMLTMESNYEQVLDYSNNSFTSVMLNFTLYLSQTVYLKLSDNNIAGYIPPTLCNLTYLKVLDLANNDFRGKVPSCLIEDGNLNILNLRGNRFEGELTYKNYSSQCDLRTIDINGNNIQGQLPKALSQCTDLEVLDVGYNNIVDVFPSWLGNLSNLRVLVLRSNQFYGTLDDPFTSGNFQGYFLGIQIIDIALNNFSGYVKPQWFKMFKSMREKNNNTGQILGHSASNQYYQDTVAITVKGNYVSIDRILTALTAMDLSNNKLNGTIPDLVGNLVILHLLNMSHNAFTGNIPLQLGRMSQLESLDLSWNYLSGEIPQELTNLTFLETLDLSNNNLAGMIPQSRQFGTFENSSFEGNIGLCGAPLSRQCASSPQPNDLKQKMSQDHVDITLYMFIGLGFGLGFAVAILVMQVPLGKFYRTISILRNLS
ncbi:receptor like protein 22 isoform X2 [Zea mays]|uniref:Disease resistance R13L4/SHOC-2-like LRR domain-containing protein n=1 Tax=Zea mays TaxID=4577 RepID=A0A804PHA4_MAIZE|nr:receptor like protein 22 isoform X2 [Zea mays]|eukprot:XP_008645599.1 receptor like protein 42 isoform X2 [Zea mays]